jgi:hypothetical protein
MFTSTITKVRFVLVAALASLSLAAATAHAQPNGGGSGGGSSSGKGCFGRGGFMDDGEIDTYHGKYENSTQTCTNGEVCTSTGVLQMNGTRSWTYECHDASLARTAPPRVKLPTTKTAGAKITR